MPSAQWPQQTALELMGLSDSCDLNGVWKWRGLFPMRWEPEKEAGWVPPCCPYAGAEESPVEIPHPGLSRTESLLQSFLTSGVGLGDVLQQTPAPQLC